jgi:3-methylcrotonyl-CoA carboxylase alpha subunit
VEHPVTEAVTGLDLVEWQLRIAAGEPLPLGQDAIAARGHAIEARLCAEDPAQDYLPQAGTITALRFPEMPGIRVDTGVRAEDAMSVQYDPLIAKVIAHGADRGEAIARLRAALAKTVVGGITTNRGLLANILADQRFAAGPVDTGYLPAHQGELLRLPPMDSTVLALAAFAALRLRERAEGASPGLRSPWSDTSGWRLFGRATARITLLAGNDPDPVAIAVTYTANGYDLALSDGTVSVSGTLADDGTIAVTIRTAAGEMLHRAVVVADADRLTLFLDASEFVLRVDDPRIAGAAVAADGSGRMISPMPGQVVAVMATAGKAVAKGDPLVVVEAMKMEHTVAAPRAGRVRAVNVAVGDRVAAGAELVALEDET